MESDMFNQLMIKTEFSTKFFAEFGQIMLENIYSLWKELVKLAPS